MSSITVPKTKTWGRSAASSRVENAVVPVMPAATPVQRRAAKKSKNSNARATVHLVDSVREVVQAFELEYYQARAESVELKAVLDDHRTQLSDLRRHLEKESSENGTLEAVVQHRAARNVVGDARLRELEAMFKQVLADEGQIASRAAALESDLVVFTTEHKRIRDKIATAASCLDLAQAGLLRRERALAAAQSESDTLTAAVEAGRRAVADREALLRREQERASRSRVLAGEAADEAKALESEVAGLRRDLARKEEDRGEAADALAAIKKHTAETMVRIVKAKETRAEDLQEAQDRLAELKQQVAAKEKTKRELDERIKAAQEALVAERAGQKAKRAEIAALSATRKETVEAEVRRLSNQLETADAGIVKAEEAVAQASDRMKRANAQFSNLMAALSLVFREYDKAVTANRQLELDAAEAESALKALSEESRRDLNLLHEKRDRLRASNAELRATVEADRRRAEELEVLLCDARKGVDEATVSIAAKQVLVADTKNRLQEGEAKLKAKKERKAQSLQAAAGDVAAAEVQAQASRARLEQCQTAVIDFDKEAAAWIPPPATLVEEDRQRVADEAAAAVKRARAAGGDESHAKRLRDLEETLTTIQDGGAAKLKAAKEAKAARLASLRDQVLHASHELADVRARGQAAKEVEAALNLKLEARREAEQRLAAEAAVAAQEAAKAATAEAAALAAAQAAAAQVAAEQAAAAQAAEAAAHRAAALRAAKAEAAKKAEPPVPRFATPETRPSNPPSSAAPRRYEPPYGGQPPARSYSKATRRQPAAATASDWLDVRQVTGGSAQTSGRARGDATNGRSRHLSADREVNTRVEPTPRRSHSDNHQSAEAAILSKKKSNRSLSKDPPTRSQQASESTAEAAGSRKKSSSSSSRKRRDAGSGGGRHEKEETSSAVSARASSKPATSSSSGSSRRGAEDNHRREQRRRSSSAGCGGGGGGGGGGAGGSASGRKGSSKSRSKSPRHRPRSPRPANKEYDLWTDNTLVGDSDFSFF